jgi:hypothetical protein
MIQIVFMELEHMSVAVVVVVWKTTKRLLLEFGIAMTCTMLAIGEGVLNPKDSIRGPWKWRF